MQKTRCRRIQTGFLLVVISLVVVAAAAPRAWSTEARGVNPADNLTKFELLPKLTVLDDAGGVSTSTFTLKFDRAIHGRYGINVELPLARFEGFGTGRNGIGDLNVRARAQARTGSWVWIGGFETVWPVASDDVLGTGKVQVNPTAVGVYAFSKSVFAAGVAKQYISVAGDEDRADISQGQYRMLAAYSTSKGAWFLLDPQLWVDYENDRRSEFAIEVESGKMLSGTVGAWLRGGGHVSGSWERQQWSVGGGIRFISF